jgi:sec-independent protein translocase protein TatA
MFRSPPVDLIVILIIVVLIMGPKRLPGIGRGIGQGMREFKDGITGTSKDEEEEEKPTLSQATPMPDATANSTQRDTTAAPTGTGSSTSERS